MVKTKTKNKNKKIKFENKKTNMEKRNIKQIIPPSPALIKQLNAMGYIISNDNVIIKVRTKESNEVQK
jgi:uncharacterized membrane protein